MSKFLMQKPFSFMLSHLFIFDFISFTWEDVIKKITKTNVKKCTMFSSRNFMVSGSTFKPLLHIEPIFFICYERVVQFDSLHVISSSFPTPFIEEALFPSIGCSCFVCHELIGLYKYGFISWSLFCFIDLFVYLCANTYCFDYCRFVI